MIFNKVTYETTSYHKTAVFRIIGDVCGQIMPIRLIIDPEFDSSMFLCSTDQGVILSKIYFNNKDIYYYILTESKQEIKIKEVKEIYLIEEQYE